jgi:branched-chain amino acid transport system substrate-binding protein
VASDIYSLSNILQITPASTDPIFTDRGLWNTFRICGRDDQQGGFAAAYILDNFKNKNVAIVNDNSTYGKDLAEAVRKVLNAAGVHEMIYVSNNRDDKDFTSLIAKLKLADIDVMYYGGYYGEAELIGRQIRKHGLKTNLIVGYALANGERVQSPGLQGEGVLPDLRESPRAASLVQKFKARGIEPDGYTIYAYAAFQVWAQAAAAAGTLDGKKIAETIHTSYWSTAIGPLPFDKKGDISAISWAASSERLIPIR